MKKRVLILGALVTAMPISLVISCNGNKKSEDKIVEVTKPSSDVVTSNKAKFPENQEYFEKTGYDPKRPLSEYNELLLNYKHLASYDDEFIKSFGSKWTNKVKKYISIVKNIYDQIQEKENMSQADKDYQYSKSTKDFYKYDMNDDISNNVYWDKYGYIPYVELYDFAHDQCKKNIKEMIENFNTMDNYIQHKKNSMEGNKSYWKDNDGNWRPGKEKEWNDEYSTFEKFKKSTVGNKEWLKFINDSRQDFPYNKSK